MTGLNNLCGAEGLGTLDNAANVRDGQADSDTTTRDTKQNRDKNIEALFPFIAPDTHEEVLIIYTQQQNCKLAPAGGLLSPLL